MTGKHTNNRMQEKQNNFGWKYSNQKNITKKAEWISNIAKKLERLEEGSKAEMHIDLLRTALKTISNWKTPGHDGIHEFWFKKFTTIHDRLALKMNICLIETHELECLTKGKTTLIRNNLHQWNRSKQQQTLNVPTYGKILTAQIKGEFYYSLTSRGLFPEEQTGSRGTGELLYNDQHNLNERKTRRKNLAMAWIDYERHMIWSHKVG